MTDEGKAERCEVVVNSHQVEAYSQRGYRTVRVCYEEIFTTQFIDDQVFTQGSSYPTQVRKQVAAKVKVLLFHMVRDGASHIAELSVILEASQAECATLQAKVAEGDKVIVTLKSEMVRLTCKTDQHLLDFTNEQKLRTDLAQTLRKMEETVGKIRKEIGEQRWRDITFDPNDQKMDASEKARIVVLDLDVQTGSGS